MGFQKFIGKPRMRRTHDNSVVISRFKSNVVIVRLSAGLVRDDAAKRVDLYYDPDRRTVAIVPDANGARILTRDRGMYVISCGQAFREWGLMLPVSSSFEAVGTLGNVDGHAAIVFEFPREAE